MVQGVSTDAIREQYSQAPAKEGVRGVSHGRLLVIVLLLALAFRLAIAPLGFNRQDRRDYISSAQKATRYGVSRFYDAEPNEKENRHSPVPYPPIPVYFYTIAGQLYQNLVDPTFREIENWRSVPVDSILLNYLIEIPAFIFESLLTLVIFFFVRRRYGGRQAIVCASLYALNPAILFNGAGWAQPDAIHSFFLTLAVAFLIERKPVFYLPMLVLAILSKPQPTVIAAAILVVGIFNSTGRELIRGFLASVATAGVILLPFLLHVESIPRMVKVISSAHPFISINAHNVWWLEGYLLNINPRWLRDDTAAFLGLTYLGVSLLVFFCFYSSALVRELCRPAQRINAEPFPYIGLMFFVIAVRMHENHAIQVLPLLLLTGLVLARQRLIFATLSLTILANMVLHTRELFGEPVSPLLQYLRALNAALNLTIFLYWTYSFFKGSVVDVSNTFRRGLARGVHLC